MAANPLHRVREKHRSPDAAKADDGVLWLLMENARQFLHKALRELAHDPKSSVIDFHSGVELVLKARLLHEHWTLIVSRDPDRGRFDAGDFASVTFDEACRRVNGVLHRPLPQAAVAAFDKVRRHRNRMVHFYHADLSASPARLRGIAMAQLQAWYQLNRLMAVDWRDVFSPWLPSLLALEPALHRHRAYACAKYRDLKACLDELRAHGCIMVDCGVCAQPAAQAAPLVGGLRQLRCHVCEAAWRDVEVSCPHCASPFRIGHGEGLHCPHCQWSGGAALRYATVERAGLRAGRRADALTPAHCETCRGYETVCHYLDGYLCVQCLAYTDALVCCGWCGGYGNGRESGWCGCMQCDGPMGYREEA